MNADGTEHYEEFVKEIMDTRLYIQNKDLRDCLEIEREEENPYTVHTLMAQFVFTGAANHSVEMYIPLEEVKEILNRKSGSYCDVLKIIREYLVWLADTGEEKASDRLNDMMDLAKAVPVIR